VDIPKQAVPGFGSSKKNLFNGTPFTNLIQIFSLVTKSEKLPKFNSHKIFIIKVNYLLNISYLIIIAQWYINYIFRLCYLLTFF
jgi:hypothetical protein